MLRWLSGDDRSTNKSVVLWWRAVTPDGHVATVKDPCTALQEIEHVDQKTEAWICRAEAHGQQLFLLTPRGRLISDNAREGAAGQEIRRNDQVVEAAAQKRNEMRPSGVCATSTSQSSALTSNVTMYLLLKYRVHRATTFASLWRLKRFCRSDAQIVVASTADCLLLARSSFKQGKA